MCWAWPRAYKTVDNDWSWTELQFPNSISLTLFLTSVSLDSIGLVNLPLGQFVLRCDYRRASHLPNRVDGGAHYFRFKPVCCYSYWLLSCRIGHEFQPAIFQFRDPFCLCSSNTWLQSWVKYLSGYNDAGQSVRAIFWLWFADAPKRRSRPSLALCCCSGDYITGFGVWLHGTVSNFLRWR